MVLNRYRDLSVSVLIVLLAFASSASAIDLTGSRQPRAYTISAQQYLESLDLAWPAFHVDLITSEINSKTSGYGQFGRPYNAFLPGGTTGRSFESPPGSGKEYLYGGAIWIGGIVGEDTLVSCAMDGWMQSQEFYPTGYPGPDFRGNIFPIVSPADFAVSSLCDDTVHFAMNYGQDAVDRRPHIPLNLLVSSRAYVWDDPRARFCLVYDMLITNIGPDTIRDGFAGYFLDCDVGVPDSYAWSDDVNGSIPSERIGYILDNDGQLSDSVTFERGFAFKILHTSFSGIVNYNWYLSSVYSGFDYGPMLWSNYRLYETDVSGTPQGDRNKYHLLRAPEWDFDQVMTDKILATDDRWVPYSRPIAIPLYAARDARFVLSAGPFDLLPDSSVRIQYALLTAENIHTDPHILDFLELAPELYVQSLNLDGLIANGRVADSLAALLRDPTYPPANLRASVISGDSIVLGWDSWVLHGIDGYQVYGRPVPLDAYVHEGVPPPWYSASDLPPFVTTAGNRHTITPVPQPGGYAFTVSHIVNGQPTLQSYPIVISVPTRLHAPSLKDTIAYVLEDESLELAWEPAEHGGVRQYNIYRFPDSVAANDRYLRHYSTVANGLEIDTVTANEVNYYYYEIEPFATVSGDQLSFTDNEAGNGYLYLVTAIDSAGFESQFSDELQVWRIQKPSKDFLVLTHGQRQGTYTIEDSIDQFYTTVLSGYDYDIYSVVDSFSACRPTKPSCLDWRMFTQYKVVIVDDNLRDNVLRNWYEDEESGFARYLGHKGVMVYCGPFASLGWPEFNSYTSPEWYYKTHNLIHRYFGADSVFAIGTQYYKLNASLPYVDSLLAFSWAEPVTDAPPVYYDSGSEFYPSYLTVNWPSATPPMVGVFQPDSLAEVIYRFRSTMPTTSLVESAPVGLMKLVDSTLTFTFGFHLWYMKEQGARELIDWIYEEAKVITDTPSTDPPILPDLRLAQNYPNPFNAGTVISFSLPQRSHVSVDVFNILGQRVKRLVNEDRSAGAYRVEWDGSDQSGNQVASGVYLYRLDAGGRSLARKMILLR